MTLIFVLILVSALIHPVWNILLKQSSDKELFYLHIHIVFIVLFSFILFAFPVSGISLSGWLIVLASSFFHFFYQVFLCRMYRLGDVSLTYPIARSSPLFVALLGFIFLKENLSLPALLGIVIIIAGTHLINKDGFSIRKLLMPLKKENRTIVALAAVTAFFSALYSTVDKRGVLEIHPILFYYLFFAFSGLFFGTYTMFFREKRKKLLKVFFENKIRITLASVLEFASYILILYAFRLSKVAYVVALRQVSVVFAAIFGALYLKEKYAPVRVIGSLVIFIGIFLVTVFG